MPLPFPTAIDSTSAKLKLVGLVRVSTEGQAADDRAGLDRQYASIKRIAEVQGVAESRLTIVTVVDVSGSDLAKTDEWRFQVLPALEDPHTHLAVDEISRLLRPDRYDFTVAQDILKTTSTIFTPAGAINPFDENGLVQIIIGALLGGSEKMAIKRRVHEAKEAKRRRGEFPQSHICLPTGVSYDHETQCWSYTPDASKVREVYRLIVEDGHTNLAAVGRMVGGEDTPISSTTIRNWLTNPIYKGLAVWDEKRGREAYAPKRPGQQADRKKVRRKPEEIIEVRVFGGEGQQPQLVPDEVWDAAQVLMEDRRVGRRKIRQTTLEHAPYSGFLFSIEGEGDYRDHIIYGKKEHRGTVYRYVCRCQQNDCHCKELERCGLPRLPAREINDAMDEFLVRATRTGWFLDRVVLPQLREAAPDIDTEIERLQADLKAVEAKLVRLQDGWLDGKVTEDFYEDRLARLQTDQKRFRDSLARALERRAGVGDEGSEDRVRAYVKRLGGFDPALPAGFRRGLLQQLVPEVIVSQEGIDLLTVRVPQGINGRPETLRVVVALTWEELLGYDMWDDTARLRARGLYTTRMLGERLGVTEHTIRNWVKSGKIPPGSKSYRGGMVWTKDEVEEIEATGS